MPEYRRIAAALRELDGEAAIELCRGLDHVPIPNGIVHWCILEDGHARSFHRCRCGWQIRRGHERWHP